MRPRPATPPFPTPIRPLASRSLSDYDTHMLVPPFICVFITCPKSVEMRDGFHNFKDS